MEHIAHFIVKNRKLVLIVAVLLLIPAAIGAVATRINYDILTYLPPELESMIGEQSLENDFHIASTAMVTVEGMPTSTLLQMKEEMAEVPGVSQVFWLSDVLDTSIPADMLPADMQQMMYGANDSTMLIVRFDEPSASESTMNAVKQLKTLLRKDSYIGGMSIILQDTKALVDQEMPWYILCAVGASLLILFLAMKSTLVPVIFMVGLIFPILYNFGSNIFLGQISYITEALATVLQLGVTMDFSIFLLHRYEEEKATHDSENAMVKAICNTFTSITASSLTTIAGFLALCTMRLTLGRDIGIVMAKGVLLGVICTITILPSLILCARKPIERFRHKTFIPKLTHTSKFITKHYIALLLVFVILFVPFALAQARTGVYYTLFDSLPQDMTGIVGTNKLKEDFDMDTTHFVLVDEDLSNTQIRDMTKELESVDGINQVLALEKYMGSAFPEDALPAEITDLFHAGGHRMLMVNSVYKSGTDALNTQIDQMNTIIKTYDSTAVITGEGAMTKDLIEIADVDFSNVSIVSIAAVFIIIALSFGSISIPVLLVASIESAIMINMGIPYFSGTQLPFIASIVIGTIQLGATVDYAILMTTRFREERRNGLDARTAAQVAVENCSQSILSSGLTFFAATIGVAAISRMELLKSICLLISRGALISMFVIILILPSLLIIFDKIIQKTTLHWLAQRTKKQHKENTIMKKTSKVLTTALSLLLVGSILVMPAAAATAPSATKDETVYITLEADGSVSAQTDSVWLHSDDGLTDYHDTSILTDIKDIKNDELPTQSGKDLVWNLNGNDVYYQGNATTTPPITADIIYTLDGKQMTAAECEGQSGHLEVTINLHNNDKKEYTINGEKRSVSTPFVTIIGTILNADTFQNITAEHGTVETDSSNQIVGFVCLPGVRDNFGDALSGDLAPLADKLQDSVTFSADVTDFSTPSIMIAYATDASALTDADSGIDLEQYGDLFSNLDELKDATQTLVDGAKALANGTGTLASGADTLLSGAGQIRDGALTLQSGAQQLRDGAASLQNGAQNLSTGAANLTAGASSVSSYLGQLCEQNTTLNNGAQSIFDSILSSATTQLQASFGAANVPALTSGNYNDVLNGLIASLGEDNIYAQVKSGVEAQVKTDANRATAQQQVTMQVAAVIIVRQQAAAAGQTLSDDEANTQAAQLLSTTAGQQQVATAVQTDTTLQAALAGQSDTITALAEQALDATVSQEMTSGSGYTALQAALAQASAGLQSLTAVQQQLDQVNTFVNGVAQYTDTVQQIYSQGAAAVYSGAQQVQAGADQLSQGATTLAGGTQNLYDGAVTLAGGTQNLYGGTSDLAGGAHTLNEGAEQLAEGLQTYQSEGISQITDNSVLSNLSTIKEVADAMKSQSLSYTSYSGVSDGCDASVKFVMKTTAPQPATASQATAEQPVETTDTTTQQEPTLWQRFTALFNFSR